MIMAYADYDEIRALTGISTTDLTSANLTTLMTISDRWVDQESEGAPSSDMKKDAANCFAASLAFQNRAGNLTENALIEIKDAIKIDTKTASLLQTGLAKTYYDYARIILTQKTSTDLIIRCP